MKRTTKMSSPPLGHGIEPRNVVEVTPRLLQAPELAGGDGDE